MPLTETPNCLLPFMAGQVSRGSASGKLSDLVASGNLEVYDFDITLPATERVPSQVVHWDALSTSLQYSTTHFSMHNGSLIHGHTTAHFDASAVLDGNSIPENAPFTLHFDFLNADVAEIARLEGIAYPLSGSLNASVTLSGTRASPHGDGRLELHNGTAFGVDVPSLTSDLRLSDGELQFNNIETGVYASSLSGSAAVSIANLGTSNNEFHLNLSGRNLNLARLPRLQTNRITEDGIVRFYGASQWHSCIALDRSATST